jgi:hypothetical protein
MWPKIEVWLISPPDREHLVAELAVEQRQFAELNQESGELVVELYPKRDGGPWVFSFTELMAAFAEAKYRLTGV